MNTRCSLLSRSDVFVVALRTTWISIWITCGLTASSKKSSGAFAKTTPKQMRAFLGESASTVPVDQPTLGNPAIRWTRDRPRSDQ